jgi:hypothetical protein
MAEDCDRELRSTEHDTRGSVLDLVFVLLGQVMTRVLITGHYASIVAVLDHLAHQTIVHQLVTRELTGRVRALVGDLQAQLAATSGVRKVMGSAPASDTTLSWMLVSDTCQRVKQRH